METRDWIQVVERSPKVGVMLSPEKMSVEMAGDLQLELNQKSESVTDL